MLPKRKLIKKARALNKSNAILEETQVQSGQSIFQKLKSSNPAHKEQAITILANLHIFTPEFNQPLFIRELVNILYQTNNSVVYQALFAMGNLCELQRTFTARLFHNGLDKALIQLSSTDKQLLKPILLFFITIADDLPIQYHFLLKGILSTLSVDHLNQNPQLCLQFLFRTLNLPSLDFVLSQNIIKAIASFFTCTYNYKEKSYAVAILSQQLEKQGKWNSQIQQTLKNYLVEMLVCIDLEKQYKLNFPKKVDHAQKAQKLEIQQNDEQQQEMQVQQKGNKKMVQSNKNLSKEQSLKRQQKMRFFINTIQATQVLLEFILCVLQKNQQSSQQSDQQEVQQIEQDKMGQQQNKNVAKNSTLKQFIIAFMRQNMTIFPKYLCLSSNVVPQIQNLVYLFYNLLMHIDKQLGLSSTNNQQNQRQMNDLIQLSLNNLFSNVQNSKESQASNISFQQYQILVQCLQIGLKVLLKNKALNVKQQFLIQFSKRFMISNQIFTSQRLVEQMKPSWLVMLELYSKKFNPQKNKNVITKQQNKQIGNILKYLVMNIPYKQLEQFRCQAIDTLFDVYSNEQFDGIFVQLGFIGLLQTVLKQSKNMSADSGQKSNKKKNKTIKFIQDVLKDIKRFLEYKYKMIKNV